MKPENHCIDCSSNIDKRTLRCNSCHAKHQWIVNYDKMLKAISSEAHHDALIIATKKRWEDPNFRYKMSEHQKMVIAKQRTDPDFNKMMADKARIQLTDPNSKLYKSMAIASKKQWSNPDNIKRISERAKKQMADPIHKKYMTDCVRKSWNDPDSKLHKNLGNFKPSSLEMKFKQYLDEAIINYMQQYRPYGCYRVYDFLLTDYNTLVEIDGNFWHESEWAVRNKVPKKDAQKEKYAIEHGYDFVRIHEDALVPTIVTDWLLPELLKVGDNDS